MTLIGGDARVRVWSSPALRSSWPWVRWSSSPRGSRASSALVATVRCSTATVDGRGGRWRRHRLGEELRAVAVGPVPGVTRHVPGVLRHADDEAAGRPRQQMGVVGVHQRIAAARRQRTTGRGGPRAPRRRGDVDRQLLAPVAVDLGDRHPAPVEEAGLHRVLGVVAVHDRHGRSRVGRPAVRGAELGLRVERTPRHPRQVHAGGRARAGVEAALAGQVLIERVAEQVGVLGVARHGEAVDRVDAGHRRRLERHARQRGGVIGRQPGAHRHPAEPVGWRRVGGLGHLGPEHLQATVHELAAEGPEPAAQDPLAGAGLERRRCRRRPAMEQREAPALLHHRRVVGERGLVERGGPARVVDERVLEQPQVAVAAERVDVLVVEAEDGADALPEEGVERGSRGAVGAPDIGGHVTGRRRRSSGRPSTVPGAATPAERAARVAAPARRPALGGAGQAAGRSRRRNVRRRRRRARRPPRRSPAAACGRGAAAPRPRPSHPPM